MTDIEELSRTVDKIEEYVEEIGDTIENRERVEEEETYIVLACDRLGSNYGILASPSWNYFLIDYRYDFISTLATEIEEEDAESFIEDFGEPEILETINENEEESNVERVAARLLLHLLSPDELKELVYRLHERTFTPFVNLSTTTDNNIITGFRAQRKIFPINESLSISKFEEIVQSVWLVGKEGNRFLSNSFDLEKRLDEPALSVSQEERPYDHN